MSAHKVAQDVADGGVAAVGILGTLGSWAELVHYGVGIAVGLVTIVWLAYRIEKLRHEKRQRGEDESE